MTDETEPTVDPVEPIEPVVNPVVGPVEPIVDPVVGDPADSVEPEPKKSGVEIIGDLLAKAKNAITGGGDTGGDDNVPDEFTEAMTAAGYSDDQIQEFTGSGNNGEPYTDEQLIKMIPSLTEADPAKAGDPAKADPPKVEPVVQEPGVEDNQEGEELKQALARIAVLEEKQGVSEEKSAEEEFDSFVNRASDLFDKSSEEFEVFGKTDALPTFPDGRIISTSPQMIARNEVFGMAQQLKGAGMPGDKALEFSLNAYKGANLATETKRNVIKNLKKQEQKLGGKRVSHEVADGNHGKDLSGPEVIAEVARRHGIELPP